MNSLLSMSAAFVLLAAAHATAQAPREPSAADVQRIRAELAAKRGQRENEAGQRGALECEAIAAMPELPPEQAKALARNAWLRLDNAMDTLHAQVRCEPVETSATERRALLLLKESSWLALSPGRWRIHVSAGVGDGQRAELPPLALQVTRGHAWRIEFTRDIERDLRRQLRALNKPQPTITPTPTPPARRGAP